MSYSGVVGGRGLARITGVAAVANLLLPILVEWAAGGGDPFVLTSKSLTVSLVVIPAAGFLLHVRSRRLLLAQRTLSETVANLQGVQMDLRTSE